jgi:hypothetical protein
MGALAAALLWAAAGPAGAASHGPTAAQARAELLKASDLPSGGWKGAKVTSSVTSGSTKTSTTTLVAVAGCEGTTLPKNSAGAQAQTSFSRHSGVEQVFDFVAVAKDASVARVAYGLFANPKAPGCVGPALASSIASGSTGSVTASAITTSTLTLPSLHTPATGLHFEIPYSAGGQKVQVGADFVVEEKGSSITLVVAVSLTTVLSTAFVDSVAKKAAARLHS